MDAYGGDVFDLRHTECSRRVGQVRANAVVDSNGVVGKDRIIVLGDEASKRKIIAHADGLVRRVDEVRGSSCVGDEFPSFLGISHHVAGNLCIRIGGKRVGASKHGFPTVGHAVAVRIPQRRIGVGIARLVVDGEAVAVNVGRVGTGGRRGNGEERFVVKAVGYVVLVDVRIFHEDFSGRHCATLRDDLDLNRRVDFLHARADLVGVAPAFAALADAVAVAVNVGEGVVGAFLKSKEADDVRVVRQQLNLAVNVEEARLRGGVSGEVGRLVQLHHHAGEVVRGGTEVAHLHIRSPVSCRAGAALGEARLERRRVAPHGRLKVRVGELGREHRHTPAVVGVVVKRPGVGAHVRANVHRRGPDVSSAGIARRQDLKR